MQLTRLGHAALLIETPYVRILIDPGTFSTDWHSLADLDAVLVTHQHADHLDPEGLVGLMGLNPTARVMVEEAVNPILGEYDVGSEPVAPGDSFEVGPTRIEAVGGTHAVIHDQIPRIGNVGFVLSEGDGARIFHPGDSYDHVPKAIDLLALPLAAPWAKVSATGDFALAVGAPEAFPIHDAVLSDTGRGAYMRMVETIAGETVTIHQVDGSGSLNV